MAEMRNMKKTLVCTSERGILVRALDKQERITLKYAPIRKDMT
jgi:hypothetical protein